MDRDIFSGDRARGGIPIGLLPVVENHSSIRLPLSSTRYILMLADSISLCICIGIGEKNSQINFISASFRVLNTFNIM